MKRNADRPIDHANRSKARAIVAYNVLYICFLALHRRGSRDAKMQSA